ncbi:MAG: Na+/H+ antiporter NhaC family protein [Gammaproteobacteria bacterium]|jgi:Na+/H+ antiporter NhaC|nr:Na+/H+ antiporter NhaC family protein [Gammaproteobacteria bacterium]
MLLIVVLITLYPDAASAASGELGDHRGLWSVLPPLLAIVLALLFRQVVPALFVGVWLGAWIVAGQDLEAVFSGLLAVLQVYVLNALSDSDHAAIILFSLMIGGMVGIISANGGMQGIVKRISHWANDARRAAITTWCMGLAIFFDDYANTLVVGNTMRPLTDRMRISRAKLAYIVDSTAAPVASIALITTWVGYEVGLIQDAIAGIAGFNEQAYLVFLNSIPYSFYPLLALFFVFLITVSGRDFGPMLDAETRVRLDPADQPGAASNAEHTDIENSIDAEHAHARNALIPIAVLIIAVMGGLWYTGVQALDGDAATLRNIVGASDSYKSLLWGSMLGVLSAVLVTLPGRLLSVEKTLKAWFSGIQNMLFAMIILLLAWSLGEITVQLGTANYLVELIGDWLPVQLLPSLVFVIAAATAFATGTSWGVMGILLPLALPMAWTMLDMQGMTEQQHWHIIYTATAAVLGGSVWGDHCSPISDTTIMSSMASHCDHIEHVRTQLPYALLVGVVAMLVAMIPVGYGLPWWLGLLSSAAVLFILLRWFGKPVVNYRP